jgi:hypothetical protein
VTLSARGFPSSATGTVSFAIGLQTLCVGHISHGVASCQTPSSLSRGTYYITATFAGDTDLLPAVARTRFQLT